MQGHYLLINDRQSQFGIKDELPHSTRMTCQIRNKFNIRTGTKRLTDEW